LTFSGFSQTDQDPPGDFYPEPYDPSETWLTGGNQAKWENGNQFLGTTDNAPIIFKTNGSQRMVLKSNGRFGFNTANPTTMFHVNSPSLFGEDMEITGDLLLRDGYADFYFGVKMQGAVAFSAEHVGNLMDMKLIIGSQFPEVNITSDLVVNKGIETTEKIESNAEIVGQSLRSRGTIDLISSSSVVKSALGGNNWLTLNPSLDFSETRVNGDLNITGKVLGNLRMTGHDLIINNPGRSGAANATRRALVHDFSDRLSLNYGSDYAGGIMLYGNVGVGVENPNSNTAERVRINGNLAIVDNSGDNQIKMYQDGTIKAREIHVMVSSETIADYVFRDDYELMSLHALKEYINDKGHLPNVPSAEEFGERGEMNLGEMDNLLLEKVEELTLYILQLEERIAELESGE
jgi:hypothetical protein